MRLSRRAVLGAALGGGSLAMLRAMPTWAGSTAAPTLLLVDPGLPPDLVSATRRKLGGNARLVVVTGPESLAGAAAWLAEAQGRRVVGEVADGDGILFEQMVPRGRAVWLSHTHHAGEARTSFVVAG
jgi:hypothetical protein